MYAYNIYVLIDTHNLYRTGFSVQSLKQSPTASISVFLISTVLTSIGYNMGFGPGEGWVRVYKFTLLNTTSSSNSTTDYYQ